jgi:chitinase
LSNCFDSKSEEEQRIRNVCTDEDSPNSRCNNIHLGYGVPGTILEMPGGCGPGRYAVAKSMRQSRNQSLPHHLVHKRNDASPLVVYDIVFDCNFTRVPRASGDSIMRIDFSNEGYWDSVVDRPGDLCKTKRDHDEFRENRKRWLEDEWRDSYHNGAMSRDELHRRWFGNDVLSWLANLAGLGQAKITKELPTVEGILNVILIDQQFLCPIGPALTQASLKANLKGQVTVDTTFGLTITATLAFRPDLSQSCLYFKNEGEITASFTLDSVASISYSSGDIKPIGLDNFPGVTFRVPGIVTIGPNLAIYASVQAAVTIAGHLQADITIAPWDTQRTYP